MVRPIVSIEKAILADICLGIPLGRVWLDVPDLSGDAALPPPPQTCLLDGGQLAQLKLLHQRGEGQGNAAVEAIVAAAEAALGEGPFSVTDKGAPPAGAMRNDYASAAKYAWPNPKTADGLPYTLRDGEVNPDCYGPLWDYSRLVRLSEVLLLLGLAYYLTDRPVFGQRATLLLDTWFIDPASRQTPHFAFAQLRPGHDELRFPAIVEARFMVYVAEAIRLVEPALAADALAALRAWYAELLDWVTNSAHGAAAGAAQNNIGFWHDLERMVFADFCGRQDEVTKIAREAVLPRMIDQLASDGSLPKEMARAHPQDYIAFTLAAMALIGRSGGETGADLWETAQGDGRSFAAAQAWLSRASAATERQQALTTAKLAATLAGGGPAIDRLFDLGLQVRALQRITEIQAAQATRDHPAQAALKLAESQLQTATRQREEAANYARALEQQLRSTWRSSTWRVMEPARFGLRVLARLRGRKPPMRARLPPAPPWLATVAGSAAANGGDELALDWASPRRRLGPVGQLGAAIAALPMLKARRDRQVLRDYHRSALSSTPDSFVLYRIVGNDLYPRHKLGQSRENVGFILENEPELPGCEKRWVLNRIVDAEEERQIIALLEARNQTYVRIPFEPDAYGAVEWDLAALPDSDTLVSGRRQGPESQRASTALFRLKNNYVMNNNGARNFALRDGRARAKWVLPWDGNCFLTAAAWEELRRSVAAQPQRKYFIVPMARIVSNAALTDPDFHPPAEEEPQIVFRTDASESFNEGFCYGRRPKVELLWRLDVPGDWDRWRADPWDRQARPLSPEAGQFGYAGWVARLFSGQKELERPGRDSGRDRGLARQDAIVETISRLDQRLYPAAQGGRLTCYSPLALDAARTAWRGGADDGLARLARRIIADAEVALTRGPYSVVDKTSSPPSGDQHDYWHVAPYWWPHPKRAGGLPYTRRDAGLFNALFFRFDRVV